MQAFHQALLIAPGRTNGKSVRYRLYERRLHRPISEVDIFALNARDDLHFERFGLELGRVEPPYTFLD